MNRLLRPRIWYSSRTSSGLETCDVLFKYASDSTPCGCPVASPSSRSRDTDSWIIRASGDFGLRIAELRDFRLMNERFQVSGVRKEKQERHDALYPVPWLLATGYWIFWLQIDERHKAQGTRHKAQGRKYSTFYNNSCRSKLCLR